MLPTMLRFELRMLARERAFWGLCALLAIVVAFGTANGLRWERFQRDAIAQASGEQEERTARARVGAEAIRSGAKTRPRGWWNDPSDVRGFAYYQMAAYAVKPPAALAALAVGQGDLLPFYYRLNAGARSGFMSAYEVENPRRLLLGRFDLAFVVVFLVPLVLLAATYDAVASEHEEGRLPLLRAHGITPRRLALVRVSLRSSILGLVAATALLLTLAAGGFDLGPPGALGATAAWSGVAAAYAAFWSGLSLLVVALARRSAVAALALAAAWLVLVVLTPWGVNLAANGRHPLPSRTEYVLALRAANDLVEDESRRYELLAAYLHDHPELAPPGGKAEAMHYTAANIVATEQVEAGLRPVQARFDAQLAHQQALVDRWQWLSPALLAQQAFVELSGAGWSRHRSFLEQVEGYSTALRAYFNPLVLSGRFEFSAFDEWPRFAWREPDSGEAAARVRNASAGLMIPALLLAAAGLVILSRYRVA